MTCPPSTAVAASRGADGVQRRIEAMAFPPLAHAGDPSGSCSSGNGGATRSDMQIRVWGSRGAIASPGADTARWDVDPSRVEIAAEGAESRRADPRCGALVPQTNRA
jgi:hypothetical protein